MTGDTPAIRDVAASGVPFRVVRTERPGSAEESAELQGIELGQLIRSIVVRRGAGDYVFVLVPGGRQIAWARLRAHLSVPRRASECFATLYGRRIGAAEYGLALAEAVGHLNRLTHAGEAVRRQGADGAWAWEARRNGA